MRISYISAALDLSGYAEAARNHIAALSISGIDVDVNPISFEGFRSDLGKLGTLIGSMIKHNPKNDIQILHLTPQNYSRYLSNSKYNIGYCAWETDKLPDDWVPQINALDEVWVPCNHNKDIFKSSGINIPIEVMPHPLNKDYMEQVDKDSSLLSNKNDRDFMFYSIFQWHERKNPLGLLKAYLTTFDSSDNVCLVIKTYLSDPSNITEVAKIKSFIREIKTKLYLKDYPKILLVSSLLSRQQIQTLHDNGDCFVSLHRAEGFGLPIAEAMLSGNPVITTGYGGPDDFVDNEIGYSVPYTLTPCYGMPWNSYTGHMKWADPDIYKASLAMRDLYENQEKAKSMGIKGQERIEKELSWNIIGKKMKNRLIKIQETI